MTITQGAETSDSMVGGWRSIDSAPIGVVVLVLWLFDPNDPLSGSESHEFGIRSASGRWTDRYGDLIKQPTHYHLLPPAPGDVA